VRSKKWNGGQAGRRQPAEEGGRLAQECPEGGYCCRKIQREQKGQKRERLVPIPPGFARGKVEPNKGVLKLSGKSGGDTGGFALEGTGVYGKGALGQGTRNH